MMTSLSGKRGIGKTYHLAKECYERYKQGYFIITNFSFVYSNIDASSLTPDEFYQLLREVLLFKDAGYEVSDLFPEFKHTGIFIAIDEGHLYFSADMYKRYQDDEDFQDIIRILAQARKMDIEIFYTTQDPSKVDKNWRRYTEDWLRFTPVLNWSYKKLIPHESKQIYRREVRYILPLVWQEVHELDHANPVFNYAVVKDENGFSSWSKLSTIRGRSMVRSGWMDPFPYKLYDSNQILALKQKSMDADFKYLKELAVVPHFMRPDKFPTIRRLLGGIPFDERMPPRMKIRDLTLPLAPGRSMSHKVLRQPVDFIDDLKTFRKRAARSWARRSPHTERAQKGQDVHPQSANVLPHSSALVTTQVTPE